MATALPQYGFIQSVMRWAIVGGYAAGLVWGVKHPAGSGATFRRAAGAAGLAGLALFALVQAAMPGQPALACLAAALLGAGAAALNVCWVDALRDTRVEAAQTVLAASTVGVGLVGLVPQALALGGLEPPVAAVAALELAASLALMCARKPARGPLPSRQAAPSTGTAALSYVPILGGLAPTLACSLVVPLLQPMAGMMLADQTLSPSFHNLLWCAGEVAAGCILLAIWRLRGPQTDTAQIFTLCLPVLATVTVLFPFLGDAYWPVLFLFSEVLRAVMLGSAVAACLYATQRRALNPTVPYSLIALLMFLADLLACAVGPLVVSVTPTSTDRARLVGLLFIFALACALLVVLFSRKGRAAGTAAAQGRTSAAERPDLAADPVPARGTQEARVKPAEAPGASARTDPPQGGTAPGADLAGACERVAAAFGLSAREAQVLALQARGRNVPFIAEELGVTPATVRSHVKRIHQALDVHTQQELIDFVEAH